tara:strand:- start:28293 stop:29078 length:786 start_codon:yes stop_codon:yes gene_type:complete
VINILKTLLIAGGIAYIGLIASALWITPRLLYPAPESGYRMGEPYEFIDVDGGERIAMIYLPKEGATELILFHHGNGEDLSHLEGRFEDFNARGFAVLSCDYPSYGHSDGTPNEESLYRSGDAIWNHAIEELGWKPSQIIHYGYSLGSGVAFELATHHPARAVVIEGAFKSIFRLYTVVRLLPWELFNNIAKVNELQAPLLVVHGTEDVTVPFSNGVALAKAGPEGTRFVIAEGAGHADVWDTLGEEFWTELNSFLSTTQP